MKQYTAYKLLLQCMCWYVYLLGVQKSPCSLRNIHFRAKVQTQKCLGISGMHFYIRGKP